MIRDSATGTNQFGGEKPTTDFHIKTWFNFTSNRYNSS